MLEIGQTAPAFALPRDGGGEVSLSEFSGKQVVLFFYPRADTSGCTKEAVGFTEALGDFDATNTVVIGISKDPVKKLDKFRDKHGLKVHLLSDEESTACEDYGVWVEKSMYGKTYMGIERATFLIGPDGTINQIWRKVKVPGHVDAVMEAAKAS